MTDVSTDRVLPVSIEAERSILGAILLDSSLFEEAADRLAEDDFSLDAHRRIYGRMKELHKAGFPVDMITLSEALGNRKEVEAIGGVAYLSSLIDGVPERPSIAHYVRIVKGKALLRGLINVAQNAITEAIEHQDEAEEVIARAEKSIVQLSDATVSDKPLVSLAEATPEAYNAMFKQQSRGLTFGIPDLDRKTHGICPEDFVILGGDPGSGKSALAGQIAAENGRAGKNVGVWSIEMRTNRFLRRLWCYESGIYYGKLRDNPDLLEKRDRDLFEDAVKSVASWSVAINDASSLSPQAFVAQARKSVLRDGMELAIVDHIQIMINAMPGKDDLAKIRELSGIFQQFSKDYCPLVALSQLTRQSKEQRNTRPVMSDLYGGRFLEMNASVICLLFIPDKDGEPTHEDEAVLAKNREGEATSVPVLFRKPLMRFDQREKGLQ